jgi:putative ABC transport system permease protein
MAHLDETEKMVQEQLLAVDRVSDPANADDSEFWVKSMTKASAVNSTIVSGAMMTFVCLYLGVVFLVASGAILALRTLSDSVDSVARYDTLRKIGVDEGDISRSLFKQTGFFFLLPLLVACFHSIFGIKMMMPVLGAVGVQHVWGSIAITCVVILAIYGGYFLMSFIGGKRIIHGK